MNAVLMLTNVAGSDIINMNISEKERKTAPMIIENVKNDLSALCAVYHTVNRADGLPYSTLGEEEFARIFGRDGRVTFSAVEDGRVVGFISGQRPNHAGVAYLTYLGVLPEARGAGVGGELLAAFEAQLCSLGASRCDIVFYDPAHLPWIIPGSVHGHPCAPGIMTSSPAARFLTARGYAEWCAQISYYGALDGYRESEAVLARRASLAGEGIEITLYDPARHHGLYDLFDAIRNPGWRVTVFAHLDQPIVVAVDTAAGGLVVGYTGPLAQVREGGGIRGSFCGIGTHPDYRGRGIGKQLFSRMCALHAGAGAEFMSLYTGETNPARRVYEAAGCRGVVRWSNLRKVFENA